MSPKMENSINGRASTAFGSLAERYERGTAGAHNMTARKLMSLSPPFTKDSRVLDNATGTGIVIEELQRHISCSSPNSDIKIGVVAADAAGPMIQYLNAKVARMKTINAWPNLDPVETHTVNAEELDNHVVPDNTITHAYMNFGLFFCSDPVRAAANMYRSLVPGGTALFTTWYDLSFMAPIHEAYQAQHPEEPAFKMPFSDKWQDRAYVEEVFVKSGFTRANIEVLRDDTYMRFTDIQTMATCRTDLFTTLVKGSKGWESQSAREAFTARLVDILPRHEGFSDEGDEGVALKMPVSIWICIK